MHRARRARAALARPAILRRAAETHISPAAAPKDEQTTPGPRARLCRLQGVLDRGLPPWLFAEIPRLHAPGRAAAGIEAPGPAPRPGNRRPPGGPGVARPHGSPPQFP